MSARFGQFRRREREGDVARGREPAKKPVMPEVLLRRAHHGPGAFGGSGATSCAEDEDLARIGLGSAGPRYTQSMAIGPENQAVIGNGNG
jgi:hypothetical protein